MGKALKLSAVVAAAGMSSRMGEFKPLQKINGFSMIEMTVMSLRSGSAGEVIVVAGRESDSVIEALADIDGVRVIVNPDYAKTSMFDSIKLGMAKLLPCDAFFVLPGDLPLLRPQTFGIVTNALGDREAAIPFLSGKQAHPPLVSFKAKEKLLSHNGSMGLKGALSTLDSIRVDITDEAALMDADTLDELEVVRALAKKRNGIARDMCEEIFERYELLPNIRRHTRATADLARHIAEKLALSGMPVDISLVESAAMLHDLFRLQEHHEEYCGSFFKSLGYDALSEVIRRHGHYDGEPLELCESSIVFLADKLVREDERVTIETRYRRALNACPPGTKRGDHIRENVRICHALIDMFRSVTGEELLPSTKAGRTDEMTISDVAPYYFNNAATSYPKPPCVANAVSEALMSPPGSANRTGISGYDVFAEVREKLAKLTNAPDKNCFALGANATWGLNIALFGYPLKKGDTIVSTDAEHNSVLRPLYDLEKRGIRLVFVPADGAGRIRVDLWERAVAENHPRLCVFTNASNVTGAVNDAARLASIAKKHGADVLVDLSQTLGVIPVDLSDGSIDMAAFTGHKYLLGPQGTGGLYVKKGLTLDPHMLGGTGIHGDLQGMPEMMPTHLEAGTGNEPSFAGLLSALAFAEENPIDRWALADLAICAREKLKAAGADVIDAGRDVTPVLSFNIPGIDASDVGLMLKESYDMTCRTGIHCAPRIQSAIGYAHGGVRVSFSRFTTYAEIDALAMAVRDIANSRV